MTDVQGPGDDRAEQQRIDPDLAPRRRGRAEPALLATIAAGGALGTAARYALGRLFPAAAGSFPWTTFAINVSGSFLLGACMAWLLARRSDDRFLRPFLAVGVLGGYTTFSTAMADAAVLFKDGHALTAAGSLVLGVLVALAAVAAGFGAARKVLAC
jgi:CrcB protein